MFELATFDTKVVEASEELFGVGVPDAEHFAGEEATSLCVGMSTKAVFLEVSDRELSCGGEQFVFTLCERVPNGSGRGVLNAVLTISLSVSLFLREEGVFGSRNMLGQDRTDLFTCVIRVRKDDQPCAFVDRL